MDREQAAMRYWLANPVEAVKAWFGVTPEDYQGDIINSLLQPSSDKVSRVAVKSAHGVGKTTTEAWVGWVFLLTREHCNVVATAPTSNQLHDVLWPEFSKWKHKMPEEFGSRWDISATHIRHKKYPLDWFATARTSNKQDNMQGFHEDHILVICEEASGIPNPIFEPIEGILSNAEEEGSEALLLLVGNPTQTSGEMYDAFNKNSSLYHRFTITGDATTKPDKNAGRFYVSKRVSQKYRDTMASKYGDQGSVYDVRVRGIFPRSADDVVIPLEWAERAALKPLPKFDKLKHPVTMVMDVSRFGGDETTLGIYREGHLTHLETWPKTSGTQCVDILVDAYKNGSYGVGNNTVVRVIVDEPGVGGAIIDQARRQDVPISPYHAQASMADDPDQDQRMFANRRSRDYWNLRILMENNLISIPNDEELINQLSSVKYDYVNEKIKVETKSDMRERLGNTASPDRADNVVMSRAKTLIGGVIPVEGLDLDAGILYGEDRPTADMDFS